MLNSVSDLISVLRSVALSTETGGELASGSIASSDVAISDLGRKLVTSFSAYSVVVCKLRDEAISSFNENKNKIK